MIRTKASLAELINSEEFHPYVKAPSEDNKRAVWHVFGDCRHNLLWVVLTNLDSGEQAIECILSRVPTPPMKERVFGMEEDDAELVMSHSTYMWKKYKEKLQL